MATEKAMVIYKGSSFRRNHKLPNAACVAQYSMQIVYSYPSKQVPGWCMCAVLQQHNMQEGKGGVKLTANVVDIVLIVRSI